MRNAGDATFVGVDDDGLDAMADAFLALDSLLDWLRSLRNLDHPWLEFLRSHRAAIERPARDVKALDHVRPDAEFARDRLGLFGELAGRLAPLLAAESRGCAG